ncbi:MAG: cytotoxin [Oscillospiraceae bacterium]|jgi:mRNA-degrading endonuclease YafQ of YafQ-DinJ toxin-antitoxin module|nr:cytotoxin [Oscillospiraceae bacterium]
MTFSPNYSKRFIKHYLRLSSVERNAVDKKLSILFSNPSHPSLRTKLVRGNDGLYECSINMDIRVLWTYESGTILLLVDVGHHDILDKL